jgi:hypothetical protein
MIVRWFDSPGYKKTIILNDVIYGFAGANSMYKIFLSNYTNKEDSENVLDLLVETGRIERAQFAILRYDIIQEELKLFIYSAPNDFGSPEIYRISMDEPLDTKIYAIGSGKHSKMYKRNKSGEFAQTPIYRIISANDGVLKKTAHKKIIKNMLDGENLTKEQSILLYQACNSKGGDLFTGGNVNMSKNASKQEIDEQILIMDQMDHLAKAAGAVCASPINAILEKQHLESLGYNALSKHRVKTSGSNAELLRKMQDQLNASI